MKMSFMQAVKEAFKSPSPATTAAGNAPAGTKGPAVADPYADDLAAKRIHERNAAFLKGLSGEAAEDAAPEGAADGAVPAGNTKLLEVLKSEDALLDNILKEQGKLHKDVKRRNWDSLQETLERLRKLSDNFVVLDEEREKIVGSNRELYSQKDVEPVFTSLRGKLTKSKVENDALRYYVGTTKEFIGNVLEECYQKESSEYSAYSANGSKVKGEFGSMLVNTEF
ncbi:MAG: hypothetical protein ILP18_04890 [Treponema sp.]|nr:hypothetical protein [Treponema sp.]